MSLETSCIIKTQSITFLQMTTMENRSRASEHMDGRTVAVAANGETTVAFSAGYKRMFPMGVLNWVLFNL